MQHTGKFYRIALLFNANKVYDRQVVAGVGQYLQASQCTWDIFMEDDFVYHKETIQRLSIDGIIADFDDPETAELLKNIDVPLVAVGGSYQNPDFYPHFPYVATDNYALIETAFLHLKQKGLNHFAFYGLPTENQQKHWAIERENAFIHLMQKYAYPIRLYQGEQTNSQNWRTAQEKLIQWIQSLPQHTGIIAVTDARARHLLQACETARMAVPDQYCVIGIDNEEIIQYLSRISLSSVSQGTKQIGYQAAKLLHHQLNHLPVSNKPLLIPPLGVEERNSTDYLSLCDPLVIQAMHYIRQRACQGIKVEQVLDHLRVSRSNLELRFKAEMNKTIHQIIHQEKMKRAIHLLRFSDIAITEIAEVCGYPSLQYFYSVFKKEQGNTPKAFRAYWQNK
ncbi:MULTISPECIES: XylR family transcriptional regulator [unclassified Avibacterium]|uniref:XylR family transcriptional regulator n=1 Tax=unclassified Avibacterium TaxID=2685287 RepID=UPI002026B6A5|nr:MULTISPECIES: DNA-binding transcriptional regulator [unclassified Avibacterium]MCW9717549.1 DNA-binding transcriptional regulator [Avibacterium sp. 21-599]URL06510.1 DNA-binding transcriptional regulator [Avibacterium sp. 21-595]